MYCKVILIGNVGADPTVKTLESGVKTANFRVATTERFTDRQGNAIDHTEWHNVVLWRGLAEVADKYVRKGSQVFIEGRIRAREWTDKEGVKRYSTDIIADTMKLLGGRRETQQGQQATTPVQQAAPPMPPMPETYNDGLPF